MKALKRKLYEDSLMALDQRIPEWREHAKVATEWKSPIHLRIIVDGLWTDFWPTTGRWYDFPSRRKGQGVASMAEQIGTRINSRPFALEHISPPPGA